MRSQRVGERRPGSVRWLFALIALFARAFTQKWGGGALGSAAVFPFRSFPTKASLRRKRVVHNRGNTTRPPFSIFVSATARKARKAR